MSDLTIKQMASLGLEGMDHIDNTHARIQVLKDMLDSFAQSEFTIDEQNSMDFWEGFSGILGDLTTATQKARDCLETFYSMG